MSRASSIANRSLVCRDQLCVRLARPVAGATPELVSMELEIGGNPTEVLRGDITQPPRDGCTIASSTIAATTVRCGCRFAALPTDPVSSM